MNGERQNNVPMHNKRPSPRQEGHFVMVLPLPILVSGCLFLPASLEGSSHRFSPRRKTRCSDMLIPVTPSSPTTVSLTSEISVIEAVAAPFAPF